jgi:hypothetical protein
MAKSKHICLQPVRGAGIARAAYFASDCGRFVWSETTQRFLKIRDGQVTLLDDRGHRQRWHVDHLRSSPQPPPRRWWTLLSIVAVALAFVRFKTDAITIQDP